MPRIIVTTDPAQPQGEDASVLMDERVHSVHLAGNHAAAQLIERLAWAISDAEDEERAPARPKRRAPRAAAARPSRSRPAARRTVNA